MQSDVGRALKKLRTERGLTQKELAARVSGGLDYTYIGKIERGEQLPSLKILIALGDALAVPVGSFFPPAAAATSSLRPASSGKEEELQKELRLLDPADLPLLVEIVRVLNRQRKAARKMGHSLPAEELPLAAEDGPSYE
ncbi:transcriptional regulator [Geotalea uraniireducens]|uniref:Transcriptional regulator n=1 Tax=Geotalea uraniireducens TaxID=351604 RepID=A0ABM8EM92_9BACT|nr:transcriptional regulator [Geotalea uraniireducens]